MQRILVAEDDPILSMIYEITLTEAGFDILLCKDGQEAFEALEAFQPDLVITDHSMPRMSGGELVSAVRRLRPGASTLMASAVDLRLLKDDQHADARLEKPITPGRLLQTVRDLEAARYAAE
ncbi:response regulator [uncultured Caulobacter sp.]|uniref:response regulator n=1 Tax=uncultured Caulobacter sp. TaxID=158749 RepID=UPI00261F62CA|nr:response regulator [uncultured Caulobacter sp.]